MSSTYFDQTANRIPTGSLARSTQVNDLRDETGVGFDMLPEPDDLAQATATYGTDTGAADAYVVTMPTTLTSYETGNEIVFIPANDNTGASTVNVDGLGNIAIKKPNGDDLSAGDMLADTIYALRYNGSVYQFVGFSSTEASAAAAEASATAAAASAAAAAVSAAAALVSENNADTSETNAAASASAASTSETNAAASEAAAAASVATIATVVPHSGGGSTMTAFRVNELRDGGTYALPLASTVAANGTVIVSLPDRYSDLTPLLQRAGADTITDIDGTDTEIHFDAGISTEITLTSDGVSDWSM